VAIKIVKLKDFNPGLFTEELLAASLPVRTFFAGFDRASRRLVTPTSAPRLISRDGVSDINDFAEPGEIRLQTDESDRAALTTLLDAHASSGTSANQVEEDLDASALQDLKTMFAGTINRNRAIDLVVRLIARETF